MHFIKQGCMLGQTIINGIKYVHSDFDFLQKFLKAIALFQIIFGYMGWIIFVPIANTYPFLSPALRCFGQNWTFHNHNRTANGTLIGESIEDEGIGSDRVVAAIFILLTASGFGLFCVAYSESFKKGQTWLTFYLFQCMPSVSLLWAATGLLLDLVCKDRLRLDQDDTTETGIKGCQIFITGMLLLWNTLLAYFGYVACCFVEKCRPKLLRITLHLCKDAESLLI